MPIYEKITNTLINLILINFIHVQFLINSYYILFYMSKLIIFSMKIFSVANSNSLRNFHIATTFSDGECSNLPTALLVHYLWFNDGFLHIISLHRFLKKRETCGNKKNKTLVFTQRNSSVYHTNHFEYLLRDGCNDRN